MSSRAQRGDLGREVLTKMKERLLRKLAMTVILCHREERSDLAILAQAKTEKRDCFAGYPVIASLFLCHRERSVAISLFCAGQNSKERLLRASQ